MISRENKSNKSQSIYILCSSPQRINSNEFCDLLFPIQHLLSNTLVYGLIPAIQMTIADHWPWCKIIMKVNHRQCQQKNIFSQRCNVLQGCFTGLALNKLVTKSRSDIVIITHILVALSYCFPPTVWVWHPVVVVQKIQCDVQMDVKLPLMTQNQ